MGLQLQTAATRHFPRFLWRVFPPGLRDALRELRARIMTPYLMRNLPRDAGLEQSLVDADAGALFSIIVAIHDAPEATHRCLMSLQKYAAKAEIILVDDGSELETTKIVLDDFSRTNGWKLIRHSEPRGHSAACDAGASAASRSYLCLLNSDTVATPWCWRPVAEAFEQNPEIGAAGPSTSSSGNSQTLPLANFARRHMSDGQICAYASCLFNDRSGPTIEDLPWLSGFALFIRRNVWERLAGFDTKLPDYGNDVELCRRIRAEGYRVVWVRNSYIHHLGGTSYDEAIGVESIFARARVAEEYLKAKHRSCDP